VIGNLEVKVDGASLFDSLTRSSLRKSYFSHYCVLLIARHLFNCPLNRISRFIVVHLLVSLILYNLRVDVRDLLRHVELHIDKRRNDLLGVSGFKLN
jgi:hypothetical protein